MSATAAARERIVITGAGAVCASGMDADTILAAVRARQSAIGPIQGWDTAGWPVDRAAEVHPFNARALVDDRKLHKFIRRTDFFGIYAGDRAVATAGFAATRDKLAADDAARFNDRTGVWVGSGG